MDFPYDQTKDTEVRYKGDFRLGLSPQGKKFEKLLYEGMLMKLNGFKVFGAKQAPGFRIFAKKKDSQEPTEESELAAAVAAAEASGPPSESPDENSPADAVSAANEGGPEGSDEEPPEGSDEETPEGSDEETGAGPPAPETGQYSQPVLSPEEIAAAEMMAQEMGKFPSDYLRGTGTTQDNRCSPREIDNVAEARSALNGISKGAAVMGMSELIRRGGANRSTPDSFKVDIKCPQENVDVSIPKGQLAMLVARHANGKTMRNLAEGMAGAIVRYGVFQATRGVQLPGDLAKKISNRLAYAQKPPLTAAEAVGCASYAQWLPDLHLIVRSDRIKGLLAEDLELRRQNRGKNTDKMVSNQGGQGQNRTNKGQAPGQSDSKKKGKGKGKGKGK